MSQGCRPEGKAVQAPVLSFAVPPYPPPGVGPGQRRELPPAFGGEQGLSGSGSCLSWCWCTWTSSPGVLL